MSDELDHTRCIGQLSEQEPLDMVCATFDINRSSYYEYRTKLGRIDVDRLRLRSKVQDIFMQSRCSAGSRTISEVMQRDGIEVGRFKVTRLMKELGLISKQPGTHAYKHAPVERPDIPNHLNRAFTASHPNQVWCGDMTYSVPGVRGKQGGLNEPRVYLEC